MKFGFTNDIGEFSIIKEQEGSFLIEVNKMGYNKLQQSLDIHSDQREYLLSFVLEDTSEELEELVIEIDNPVKLRGDTIIYDAKAFRTGREVVVEDLWKNIPGISIDKKGVIKYESVEIEKVMIEGDDFFNREYSILTQNMPSSPLNKIEMLRKHSNNRLLKGVEDTEKVALNLTIQDAYRNMWFGDLSIGYGVVSENRYNLSGNLMNFSQKYKNFLNFGFNNIGIDRVGSLGSKFRNNNEIETIGSGSRLYQLMGLNGERTSRLKDHRKHINNSENVSLSTIVPIGSKLKVKWLGFLNTDEKYSFNHRYSVNQVENIYFENNEYNYFKSYLKSYYLNLLITNEISATPMLQMGTMFNNGSTDNTNNLTFNGINTTEIFRLKTPFPIKKSFILTNGKANM